MASPRRKIRPRKKARARKKAPKVSLSTSLVETSLSLFAEKGFETAAIGMAFVGTGQRFLRVNRSFCDFVGYTRLELEKMTIKDVTHPDEREADRIAIAAVVGGEKTQRDS